MHKYTILFILMAGVALAQQPYSKSMAECAGLFSFARDNVQRADAVELFERGAAAWTQAALEQAEAEGRDNPSGYVADARETSRADWSARGSFVVFSEDFTDWMDYCRSFADHLGLDLIRG